MSDFATTYVRLEALKREIEARDWERVEWEYDRVLSAIQKDERNAAARASGGEGRPLSEHWHYRERQRGDTQERFADGTPVCDVFDSSGNVIAYTVGKPEANEIVTAHNRSTPSPDAGVVGREGELTAVRTEAILRRIIAAYDAGGTDNIDMHEACQWVASLDKSRAASPTATTEEER